ncbi:MAG: hypothetical protein KDC54_14375 [Lewinella sp.]|nr:hypothetical protein [Lewinella sp.]
MYRFLSCTLFILLSSGWNPPLSAQPAEWPDYEAVVRYYFDHYQAPGSYYQLAFSRRPDGYYAERKDGAMRPDGEELFYDFATGKFLPLTLFPAHRKDKNPTGFPQVAPPDDLQERSESYLNRNSYARKDFELLPYCQYVGWYKDVITLYEGQEAQLSSWELQALGRAYQSQASALLNNDVGLADPEDSFHPSIERGQLTEAQIATYLGWVDKELAVYQRLEAQDPDFMTPVGPVSTKHDHEVMDAFVTLYRFQHLTAAQQVLRPGLYDEYLLHMGRNLLRSCPPDAILFVWGDSDTYPLYYLQAKEGVRRDVILINMSLIVTPRYQRLVYGGPFSAKPLATGFPPFFFDQTVLVMGAAGPTAEVLPLEELYAALGNRDNYQPMTTDPKNLQVMLPSVRLELPVPGSVRAPLGGTADELVLNPGNNYLAGTELVLPDLLMANNWQRPVCFSPTVTFLTSDQFIPFLVWEGMVLRFYPLAAEASESDRQGDIMGRPIDIEPSFAFWRETFRTDTAARITDFDKAPYQVRALMAGLRLIEALAEAEDTTRCRQMTGWLMNYFPDEQDPWGMAWTTVVEPLAAAGLTDLAEQIGLTVVNNLEQGKLSEWDQQQGPFLKERLRIAATAHQMNGLVERLR